MAARYQYETSPRKIEPNERREKRKENIKLVKDLPRQEIKISKEQKMKHRKATLLVLAIFAVLFTISYRNTKINEKFNEMQTLKTEVSSLQKENEQLQVTIENSLNLSNIEKQAKEKLGMQKLTNKQTVYVNLPKKDYIESRRIVAEHLRSSMMIISDGGRPSNIDRGYVLRRLIRRLIRHLNKLQIDLNELTNLIEINVENLKEMYPDLEKNKDTIKSVIIEEKDKFVKTLAHGEREFEKEVKKLKEQNKETIPGTIVFRLYDTYGFPPEVTKELAQENGFKVDLKEFEELFKKHQEKSRQGAEHKFKGGLADQNEKTIAYHTATHLLHQALRTVLGDHVKQSGSNITEERLRFDFTHPQKMTKEEIQKVEDLVNEQIQRNLDVTCEEMSYEDAKKSGAIGLFTDKYGDKVKVYTIGDFSKEICGGPHVSNTKGMGTFKIKKEESSSSGIRRIKAVLI